MSRVGFDNVKGYLKGGFSSWKKNNKKFEVIKTVSAIEIEDKYYNSSVNIFDVRKLSEYQSEHIINATNIPLNDIYNFVSDFNVEGENYIHCAGGYRSMIANSILKSNGVHNLIDIRGGFASIKKTNISTTEYICPSTL